MDLEVTEEISVVVDMAMDVVVTNLEITEVISLVVDGIIIGVTVIPIILLDRNVFYYEMHTDALKLSQLSK